MSTQIGTLQARARMGHLVWPAVVLALLVAVTVAVIATSTDREVVRPRVEASTSSTLANTPSEISAANAATASVVGTLANTPSELRSGFVEAPAPAWLDTIARIHQATEPGVGLAPTAEPPGSRAPGQGSGPIGFHPLP